MLNFTDTYSPDANVLFQVHTDFGLDLLLKLELDYTLSPTALIGLAWTADGTRLVSAASNGRVWVHEVDFDALTAKLSQELALGPPSSLAKLTTLAVSPSLADPLLALAGNEDNSSIVQVCNLTALLEPPVTLIGPMSAVTGLAWSANGTNLAASSGKTVQIWDVKGGL
eukprot:scaffold57081_cov16-Prasinocladus_malaysianus.AAC.1